MPFIFVRKSPRSRSFFQERLLSDVLNNVLEEERKAKIRKQQEERVKRILEANEAPQLPRVCQKYDKKFIGCQSEEIILAGFERSGVKWTATNLEIITSHYTCEVSKAVRATDPQIT